MAKRSKTSLNIDKINRQLDRISKTFGPDSVEVSNYITQNKLDTLSLRKTSKGVVHIRNTAENRLHYQRISAVSKKPVKQFIARSKAAYKPPKVKKSPIPEKIQLPKPADAPEPLQPWEMLATTAEIMDYIYSTSPYRELSLESQQRLCNTTWRKHPTFENIPPAVEQTYKEIFKDLFDETPVDDYETVEEFSNPDFLG